MSNIKNIYKKFTLQTKEYCKEFFPASLSFFSVRSDFIYIHDVQVECATKQRWQRFYDNKREKSNTLVMDNACIKKILKNV